MSSSSFIMSGVSNTPEDSWAAVRDAGQRWASFDWSRRSREAEEVLSQAKDAREQSVAARKALADTTKQFKKAVKALEQAAASSTAAEASVVGEATSTGSLASAVDTLGKHSRNTVKAYQEEIDQLTRRCKVAETSHSTLCQDLFQSQTDPAWLVASCVEQWHAQQAQLAQLLQTVEQVTHELHASEQTTLKYKKELAEAANVSSAASNTAASSLSKEERDELVQLRREVAEYEVEFRSLKNQDITIRKLEAKIADLQQSAQQDFVQQLEAAKQELAETEGRRTAEALEREAAMERKVQTLELQLRAERAGRDATQAHLFEADEGVSQREAAWEAQKRILVDDAERLREQLQAVTSERDELSMRVAANATPNSYGSKTGGFTPPPSGGASVTDLILERKAYEAEVAELSETTTLLREELKEKEEGLVMERRQSTVKIQGLERQSTELAARVVALESQLASAPSQVMVETMKRELRILKRLEYNADDHEVDRDPEIAGINEDKDLESVLVAKLRRAESDLITERTTRADLRHEIESLKKELAQVENAKVDLEKLVSSLEKDLERAISAPASTEGTPRSKTLDMCPSEGRPNTLQEILDPSAPLPPPEPESPAIVQRSATAQEKAEDDHSVATIVMAQRDRLRARCDALEAERDSFKRELQAQVQASESLKSDNTKLYEKIRYLQSYDKTAGNRGSAYHRSNSLNAADRDLDLEALEQRYEASVDPFRQFSRAERQRKLNEMSPMERTVFIVAKTFLGTKEMRTALFFYVIGMHLLVFITTYHWSHTGGCHTSMADLEHLSHLPPAPPVELPPGGLVKAAPSTVP